MKEHGEHHLPAGFVLDKEKIRRFMHTSPAAKLQWLEDANAFLIKALGKDKLKRWEKFRRGEI
jgi:hypothetical protein